MNDVDRLAGFYGRAADRIRAGLQALDPGRFDPTKAEKALVRARTTVKALNEASTEWVDSTVDSAYEKGARTARTILEILGKRPVKPQTYDGKRNLKDDVAEALIRANNSMLKVSQDFVALSAMAAKTINQAALQEFDFEEVEGQMTSLAQQAVAQESSRKDLAGQIRSELGSRISDNNLIEINGKQWNARAYSDMVARTTIRDAQTAATLDLCREYDNDLVEVSSHDTKCEECAPYEGQIYSISGKNPNYPPLVEAPPFHPNCEHSLLPTTDVEQDLIKLGPGKAGWIDRAEWLTAAEKLALLPQVAPAPPRPKRQPKPKPEPAPAATAGWKPSMTKEEADIWAKDSVVKKTLNHNTSTEQVGDSIMKNGFTIGEGAAYGRGVYMSTEIEAEYGLVNLQVRVNIQKVVNFEESFWQKSQDWWYKKGYYRTEKARIGNTEILSRWGKAMGYDAFKMGGEDFGRWWYVVLDPKKVTVIAKRVARRYGPG